MEKRNRMGVEIYSDIACPWCYIGTARFARALDSFAGGHHVDVTYRPYQLDPNAPQQAEPMMSYLARRFGRQAQTMADHVIEIGHAEGLAMDYGRGLAVNTLNAHRLLRLAEHKHGPRVQSSLARRLYEAHFSDGRDVSDYDVLVTLAADVGMSPAGTRDYLVSGKGTDEVREEIGAARRMGITAVPTFIFGGKYMIEGAQPANVFVHALEIASREAA
jgi:predicted DsbA family dithiol-disulfide isomerase